MHPFKFNLNLKSDPYFAYLKSGWSDFDHL